MYVLTLAMPRRTKADAQATRDRILDMAEREFQRRGVSRTTLQDIARAAGLTRGAIYWHFRDKADLFDAMMKRVTLPLEQAIRRSGDPRLADPLAHARRSFLDALRATVSDEQARRVIEIAIQKVEYVDEMAAVRTRRLDGHDRRVAEVERGLRLARRQGRVRRRVGAHAAALGLHALVDGLIHNWMLDPGGFDLVAVGRQAIDCYLAGLESN